MNFSKYKPMTNGVKPNVDLSMTRQARRLVAIGTAKGYINKAAGGEPRRIRRLMIKRRTKVEYMRLFEDFTKIPPTPKGTQTSKPKSA